MPWRLRRLLPPRALGLALAAALLAPATPARAEPGDELTISVLTFGPGDHPFYKFGHNAVLVHDARARRDSVYNFGTFAFESPLLILDFLKGRLRYWLSVQSLPGTIYAYHSENRSIDAQELNLTPAQRLQIARALAENELPQNRYYKYDYYGDNCSTRVRDAVDRVIDGRLRAASQGPASMSFRAHTLRLTADDLPVYLGLDVAMGDVIDKPIRVWEEMFLPSKLEETLRAVQVPGPDGAPVPLVKSERVLLAADRAPLREAPPRWKLRMALVGAASGGLLAWLGSRPGPWPRRLLGALLGLSSAVLGLLGLIFLLLWCTDHQVAHHNENLLQCVPWGLAISVFAVGLARGKPASTRRALLLTGAAAGASLLGLLLKVLPWFDQANGDFIALLLPLWAGAAAGVYQAARRLGPAALPGAAAGGAGP